VSTLQNNLNGEIQEKEELTDRLEIVQREHEMSIRNAEDIHEQRLRDSKRWFLNSSNRSAKSVASVD